MTRTRAWSGVLILMAALFSFLKLFTYHYVLSDDPTTGIALRTTPALDNGPSLLADRDVVLVADENEFLGEGLYALFARGGWLLAVAGPLLLSWRARESTRTQQAR